MYGLSRYVLEDRVGYYFCLYWHCVACVILKVVKLYELTVQCVNAQLNEKQIIC